MSGLRRRRRRRRRCMLCHWAENRQQPIIIFLLSIGISLSLSLSLSLSMSRYKLKLKWLFNKRPRLKHAWLSKRERERENAVLEKGPEIVRSSVHSHRLQWRRQRKLKQANYFFSLFSLQNRIGTAVDANKTFLKTDSEIQRPRRLNNALVTKPYKDKAGDGLFKSHPEQAARLIFLCAPFKIKFSQKR